MLSDEPGSTFPENSHPDEDCWYMTEVGEALTPLAAIDQPI
jgi:hypothetical protein